MRMISPQHPNDMRVRPDWTCFHAVILLDDRLLICGHVNPAA